MVNVRIYPTFNGLENKFKSILCGFHQCDRQDGKII